jgi:hypothetical protein
MRIRQGPKPAFVAAPQFTVCLTDSELLREFGSEGGIYMAMTASDPTGSVVKQA